MNVSSEAGQLGDTLNEWDPFFRDRPPHGLLLIANDDPAELDKSTEAIRQLAAPRQVELRDRMEAGFRWKRQDWPTMREPFGFADGVSDMVFLQEDIQAQPPATHWDPVFPLERVLLNPATRPRLRGCSFLVYRKLTQCPDVLDDFMAQQGPAAAEAMVGRTRAGVPLATNGRPGDNNFNYDADGGTAGTPPRCPFHAHIRKANPRRQAERSALFARRSVVFAASGGPTSARLTGEQGLHFMGYMSSIAEQFFKMQAMWLNNEDSPGRAGEKVGRDPLLFASHQPAGATRPQRFVVPRGGGYYFVPTRDWLTAL
jgi:Dyp-type peroxidase family